MASNVLFLHNRECNPENELSSKPVSLLSPHRITFVFPTRTGHF